MELDYDIIKRKSVRNFKDKPVSIKDVLKAVEAGNQGPFAGNMNHFKYIIIENKDNIKKMANIANQHWIAEAQTIILMMSDDRHLEAMYGERGRVYSRQQAGATIQTILLKLVDLGLSACWVGAYSDELIKQNLGIPGHMQIECMIPVGYEKPERGAVKPRKKPLHTSMYWEVWERSRRPVLLREKPDRYSLRRD